MSIMSFVSGVIERLQERKQRSVESYAELVQSVAAGTEPDLEQIETILRDSGRSHENLAKDVELLLQRHTWVGDVAASEKALAQINSLEPRRVKAHSEYKQKIDAANQKIREDLKALDDELASLQTVVTRGQDAHVKLKETAENFREVTHVYATATATGQQLIAKAIEDRAWNRDHGKDYSSVDYSGLMSSALPPSEVLKQLERDALEASNVRLSQPAGAK